jgi:hypothetical protein
MMGRPPPNERSREYQGASKRRQDSDCSGQKKYPINGWNFTGIIIGVVASQQHTARVISGRSDMQSDLSPAGRQHT